MLIQVQVLRRAALFFSSEMCSSAALPCVGHVTYRQVVVGRAVAESWMSNGPDGVYLTWVKCNDGDGECSVGDQI